jgi:chromosomal replication initiator protein
MAGEQLEFGDEPRVVQLRRAWDAALRVLAGQVSKVTFESYIRPIRPLEATDHEVVLGVTSAFAREWVKTRYISAIRTVLEEHLGGPLEIRFTVVTSEERPLFGESAESRAVVEARVEPERKSGGRAHRPDLIPSLPLNEKSTFDTYVTGRSNRLAHAAAQAVSGAPGTVYNPLFIYGSSGLGKTHLLHAIGNAARKKSKSLRISLVDGESFTQHYVSALRDRKMDEFRRHFRTVDIWLVDDIQFVAGREQTKEEFFHTFNALHQTGKQIVISSDRSPRELRTMDERLRSRFEAGLVADINAPELEVRMAILQRRCETEGWEVPEDVVYYIASAIHSNVRALEGALNRLVAYASVMGLPQDVELAQNILGEYFIEKPLPGGRSKGVQIDTIQVATAEELGVTQELMKSQRRDQETARARQVAMYLCRELTNTPLVQIGAAFGGRDHTTVQRAVQKIEGLLPTDRILASHLQEIRRKLER